MTKIAAPAALAGALWPVATASAGTQRTVVRTVVLRTTDGFSTGNGFTGGTILGGDGSRQRVKLGFLR